MKTWILGALALSAISCPAWGQNETQCNGSGLPEPVLFVLQYPVFTDFATIGSVFANHRGTVGSAGRGGDLMICYPNGTLRNLTRQAGFGATGQQGANAISVRDPHVHWDGQKALFSMVVGAPTQQYQVNSYYWQLYEVTGLGAGQTVAITRVANQPADYNNIQPAYLVDDSIVFVSDRPRNGQRHLYPQLDEYESTPTPTGLWKIASGTGQLTLMEHSPSGSFEPFVDRYGRVVFTRWDHLMRDQQADNPNANPSGAFNYQNEAENSPRLSERTEVFPESRLGDAIYHGIRTNHFMPWMINADGTGMLTLNHIGRHDLFHYFEASFKADTSLDHYGAPSGRNNVINLIQTIEDTATPGRYIAINAPEFGSHASGQLVAFNAPPELQARDLAITYLSDSSGAVYPNPAPPGFARYRNPAVLSNGAIIAAHTTSSEYASGSVRYQFRINRLTTGGSGTVSPGQPLTNGISRSVSFWNPDALVSYSGVFWEFSPVPVRARTRPAHSQEPGLESPEQSVFAQTGTNIESFKQFLKAWNLGVIVVRNATSRDFADRQQPFNLRVPGGVQSIAPGFAGHTRDIAHMRVVQGDQIRAYDSFQRGRRTIAQWLHAPEATRFNPPNPAGGPGSAKIASDGSVAIFVPARRALSWQVDSPGGQAVVRERYWLSVQPGEIRACDGCHGATPTDQRGQPAATNTPLALRDLLVWFNDNHDPIFNASFQN